MVKVLYGFGLDFSRTHCNTDGEHVSLPIVMRMRGMAKEPQFFVEIDTVNRCQTNRVHALNKRAFVEAKVFCAQGVD